MGMSAASFIRSLWRKTFYPRGPSWWKYRLSSITLIMALHRCDFATACAMQKRLDDHSLRLWLEGH